MRHLLGGWTLAFSSVALVATACTLATPDEAGMVAWSGAAADDAAPVGPVREAGSVADADAGADANAGADADADASADANADAGLDADADADAGGDPDAADADTDAGPYACKLPPVQCDLQCDTPTCSLVCKPDDPTSCQWDCPAPTCTCGAAPTATCELYQPAATCVAKCAKPECEIKCPVCTASPCLPCQTYCKVPECVTVCQTPSIPPSDGGQPPVVHCQPPAPSCRVVCDPIDCVWENGVYSCSPPRCHTSCDEPGPARCDIKGCSEACDPLTDCTQKCDAPTCVADAVTGAVSCDGPTACVQQCRGGACHVTSCL
ncbi:MAG: hypothetical protein JWP97_6529 [Labilithrix sp.]|nr:hypothetical protein [Labilithrix sp.]